MSEDPREALLTQDALFAPERWPLLEPAASPDALAALLRRIAMTPDGRTLFHTLVVRYLFDETPGLSAERQLGREDVVKHCLQLVGLGYAERKG